MTIMITYELAPGSSYPCWARATVNGFRFSRCGKSFEEAKADLLTNITAWQQSVNKATPPPEEIEIGD